MRNTTAVFLFINVFLITYVTAQTKPSGKLVEFRVSSNSLKGNLLGDSIDQKVAVYLPPGYETSGKRYPSVYLLHGYMSEINVWTNGYQGMKINVTMDELINSGKIPEMIIVIPNGMNKYKGSFYANSSATGYWEDHITKDVVNYVDKNYRTLARPESRGIAGHSMGGYGSIVLGMKHPEVFSAIYALSPCCLGLEGDLGADNAAWMKAMQVQKPDVFSKDPQSFEDFFTIAFLSMSAALSPATNKAPMYVDLPFKVVDRRIVPNEPAYSEFRSKLPLYMIEKYRETLSKMRGIYIDYGQNEEFSHIRITTGKFSEELTDRGIPHIFEVYKNGDHGNLIKERIETKVLDFFGKTLDFRN